MKPLVFAGNWKMHHGPPAARRFLDAWLPRWTAEAGREVWLFPPAASLPAVAEALAGITGCRVGVQNVHWEAHGAYTGEISVGIARDAGASLALIGHSERRHVFGESDADCARKLVAVLAGELTPVLCVGETLDEREAGTTETVVLRQLAALDSIEADQVAAVTIAYEPVWAIGTGRTATPEDADMVHGTIRRALEERGVPPKAARVLYGGSVKPANVAGLVTRPNVDGVLVGGASLDPDHWAAITSARPD